MRISKLAVVNVNEAPSSGSKLYQFNREYIKRNYPLRTLSKGDRKSWLKLVPENSYTILLETMGLNLWSKDFLIDRSSNQIYWNLHHINENKRSLDPNVLIIVYDYENLGDIPHLYRLNTNFKGKICTLRDIYGTRRLLRTRKVIMHDAIIQLLKLGRTITKNDLGSISQVLGESNIDEFSERINFFITHGEVAWFERYYDKFYNDNIKKPFWGTHYLTFLRNQNQNIP
ncbi:MAG: hypothetical protein ACFE8V_11115 [Promethearchaeota archaeon]